MQELPSFVGLGDVSVTTVGNFRDTPLHVAAVQNDLDAIRLLVEAGGDINAKDEEGYSPLHEAVEQGNNDAVILLLNLGADVDVRNDNGLTPDQLAALVGNDVFRSRSDGHETL
jgi:ankyrin repeat protein